MKSPIFNSEKISKEIDYISSHFYELIESKEEELYKLDVNALYHILDNEKLQLKDEDQLLNMINCFYSKNQEYRILYETVNFKM